MIKIVSRTLSVAGVSALLLITSACGGGNTTEICDQARAAMTQYTSDVAAAAGGDMDKINAAKDTYAAKLDELSGQADGDLKSALSSMASAFAQIKVDTSDPAGSAAKLSELSKQAVAGAQKLGKACA
jgi:hypothetical protein